MGDRANFGFRWKGYSQAQPNTVYLYAHWGGYNMLSTLANALCVAQPRWKVPSYATRICISHIVGDDWDNEHGYGIYVNEIGDNEHSIPVIDWDAQTFTLYKRDGESHLFSTDFGWFINKYSTTHEWYTPPPQPVHPSLRPRT